MLLRIEVKQWLLLELPAQLLLLMQLPALLYTKQDLESRATQ